MTVSQCINGWIISYPEGKPSEPGNISAGLRKARVLGAMTAGLKGKVHVVDFRRCLGSKNMYYVLGGKRGGENYLLS